MSSIATLLKSPQAVGRWMLVPGRSSLRFSNKTFWGLMNVKGRFTEFSGDGLVGEGGTVTGKLVIKAASVHTGIRQRDNHLRSADFFDAENHPDIVVTVNGVQPADGDEVNVAADLTIRGHTVAFPFRAKVSADDDGTLRATATTTVDRERLGVSGNMAGMMSKTTTVEAETVFRHGG